MLSFFRTVKSLHPSPSSFVSVWLVVAFVVASVLSSGTAHAQITRNQFVGAKVSEGGLITIYKGNPANNEQLTFERESFLTLKIEGKYYSNSAYGQYIANGGNQAN